MGNLVFLQRSGGKGDHWVEMDFLNLKYDANGNLTTDYNN
jgi:hypothetical protein